jgi:hypothetical protein
MAPLVLVQPKSKFTPSLKKELNINEGYSSNAGNVTHSNDMHLNMSGTIL